MEYSTEKNKDSTKRWMIRQPYIQSQSQKIGIKERTTTRISIYRRYQANCANLFSNGDIMSARVNVGNSDLVGEFAYECSEQLVDLISKIKTIDGVDRVAWSEGVFLLAGKKHSMLAALRRIIDRE
jgi:hypothetical protein